MNADDPVRRALEALRADDASLRASRRVEQAVFAAFEERPRQGTNHGIAVAVAVAATLAAAVSYVRLVAPSSLAPARERPVAAPVTADRQLPPRVEPPAIDTGTRPPTMHADRSFPATPTPKPHKPRVTMTNVPVRSAYVQT